MASICYKDCLGPKAPSLRSNYRNGAVRTDSFQATYSIEKRSHLEITRYSVKDRTVLSVRPRLSEAPTWSANCDVTFYVIQ